MQGRAGVGFVGSNHFQVVCQLSISIEHFFIKMLGLGAGNATFQVENHPQKKNLGTSLT